MTDDETHEGILWWSAIDEERRRVLAREHGGLSEQEALGPMGGIRAAIIRSANAWIKLDPDRQTALIGKEEVAQSGRAEIAEAFVRWVADSAESWWKPGPPKPRRSAMLRP